MFVDNRVDEAEKLLSEFLEIKEMVKPLLKRLKDINSWCKTQGSFCTDKYVCSVEEREREAMVSKKEAIFILTEEAIRSLGLMKKSKYLLVHISRKGPH
jgi:hypothetical protein